MHWTAESETTTFDQWFAGLVGVVGVGVGVLGFAKRAEQGWGFTIAMLVLGLALVAFGVWKIGGRVRSYSITEVYQAWGAWAVAHGLNFVDAPASLTLPTTKVQVGGFGQPITHAARGQIDGHTVVTLLLGFTTTNVKGEHAPFIETVLAAHTKSKYPPVTIVPQKGVHSAAAAMGKDVLVESDDFNRRYRVIAQDKQTAHAVLQPRVIERLLQWGTDTSVTWDGNSIILKQTGLMGDAANLDAHLALLADLADMVLGFHQVEPAGASHLRRAVRIRPKPVKAEMFVSVADGLRWPLGIFPTLFGEWRFGIWSLVPG